MSFLQMAATAVQAVGAIAQGESSGRAANMAGDVARANASAARMQSSANEDTLRRRAAMQMGDIRARAAEGGFDPSTGSAVDIQAKSAGELELDILTRRYEGELRALSFDAEERSMRYQAKAARRGGYMSAAMTVLGSAATEYGRPRIGPPAPVESRIPKPTGR